MAAARQNAWNNAVLLTGTSFWNRWIVLGAIDTGAVAAGSLIAGLTLSPTLKNTLRALEGTNPGSTFCRHFPCGA